MAEYSGFFDSHLVDGEYDRVYLAEHFAKYFASFIGNGIFGGKSDELIVLESETPSMGVRIFPGQAWINGYWYENDDGLPLAIDVADGILHRIDSIVVRWNNSNRIIRIAIKKGVPSANPIAPIVQRDDDYYELKLADVYVKAGATRITQANIYDKRLDTNVCGLVIGVVQQLDSEEFGIQLGTYIREFIEEHDEWKRLTYEEIEQWINEFKTSYTNWFTQFKSESQTSVGDLLYYGRVNIDNLVNDGNASINGLITVGQSNLDNALAGNKTEFDSLVARSEVRVDELINTSESKFNQSLKNCNILLSELEEIAADNNLVEVNRIISALSENVENLQDMFIEDEVEKGCYYSITENGEKEWINPPNKSGIEYRTSERWNGSPVYRRVINLGALSNKAVIAITVLAEYDKIFSIEGFAFDPENILSYPFPIIINGLSPAAVISGIEGNGSESIIIINVNEDLSMFTGHIIVKYTK